MNAKKLCEIIELIYDHDPSIIQVDKDIIKALKEAADVIKSVKKDIDLCGDYCGEEAEDWLKRHWSDE